jgi:hypothetical protein
VQLAADPITPEPFRNPMIANDSFDTHRHLPAILAA